MKFKKDDIIGWAIGAAIYFGLCAIIIFKTLKVIKSLC